MKKSLFLYLLPLTLLSFSSGVSAQTVQADSSYLQSSLQSAIQSYRAVANPRTKIFNGPEYFVPVRPHVKGHQFYSDKTLETGAVFFDGSWFDSVPLLYDVVLDEVITFHEESGYFQRLIKQKVDTFSIKDQVFVQLKENKIKGTPLKAGFYKLFYNGDVKALVRKEKVLQERTTTNGLVGNYTISSKYFILKDDVYHQVSNKASVFRLFRDEKKQLQKFARANDLNFRSNREEAIAKTVQYYDSLKP